MLVNLPLLLSLDFVGILSPPSRREATALKTNSR
jgi:hypothetical protein